MSGIAHLAKDNKTRAARIDSMDTDSVNSIIERISGVNPTKLAEGTSGASPAQPAESSQFGAPPSPITQNFMPQHQAYGPDQTRIQQMQERMQMLEQRVAYYEGGGDGVESAAAKKVRQSQEVQTNRGTDSSAFAPNMNTKMAAKKIMKKDPIDGEPDGVKAQRPGGQAMASEQMNILGISMNEWNDLIGVTTPYASQVSEPATLAESTEEYEEFVESYFTEDELAEAWFDFIGSKGYDPDDFSSFVEAAEDYGDEAALLAIQDLEDEFQEAVDACIEAAEDEEDGDLTQEDVDQLWELWLEDRGLSLEMFHYMIDEAVAADDEDEISNLIAVEDLFYEYLDGMIAEQSTWAVKSMLRGKAGQQLSPSDLGMKSKKPVPDVTAKTRKQGAAQKGSGVMVGRGLRTAGKMEAKIPPMHPRSGEMKRMDRSLPVSPPSAKGAEKVSTGKKKSFAGGKIPPLHPKFATEATAAEFNKEFQSTGKSILDKDTKPTPRAKSTLQIPSRLLRKAGAAPDKPASGSSMLRKAFGKKQESRRGFPSWNLMRESDSINFECDDDGSGGPSIDWERLTNSYEKRGKGKR